MKNIKKILILLVCTLFASGAFSQASLEVGKIQLNLGSGVSLITFPPLYAGIDYGIHRDVTVGMELVFMYPKIYGVVFNGNYHFNHFWDTSSRFDAYAGLHIGYLHNYKLANVSNWLPTPFGGMLFPGQIGCRFFFSKSVALNLEFSGAYILKLCITYKF